MRHAPPTCIGHLFKHITVEDGRRTGRPTPSGLNLLLWRIDEGAGILMLVLQRDPRFLEQRVEQRFPVVRQIAGEHKIVVDYRTVCVFQMP